MKELDTVCPKEDGQQNEVPEDFLNRCYDEIIHYIDFILRETKPRKYIVVCQDGITPKARLNFNKRKKWYCKVHFEKNKYDPYFGFFNYGTVHAEIILERVEELLRTYCQQNQNQHQCQFIMDTGKSLEKLILRLILI